MSDRKNSEGYGDEGGALKDGVIEIRRGVADLDLGDSHYAQVRILVDGTHYLKGMAMYSDDMPDGADIVFNTNKHTGTPKMDVLKKIQDDPDNPFGALIKAVEGWIKYCEAEMTLTDGSDLHLLDSFKLWGEQVFGWYYFVERTVYEPNADGRGGHYVKKMIKKRLVNKQYLIVGRGAAKSIYDSCIQSFFENVDTSTTHQITTAPTMKLAEEVMSPIRTAITRARGPVSRAFS